jgi:hypothetical protein
MEAGVFSSAVPGLHAVPAPSQLPVRFKSGQSPLLKEAIGALPESLLPPLPVMLARTAQHEVRVGYSLRAVRNGEIISEEAIGRTWEPLRDVTVAFPPALDYASGRVSMHPGLAALAEEIMDRHALTALGNVSRVFGNVQASQLTTEARMAFRALPRMPTNHVRYVYRLAALWQAACATEAAGGTLEYRGSHAPLALDVSAINSVSSFCALLEDGHLHHQNVVYFETTGLGDWSNDLARVLRVACDPRPHFRATVGRLPGITKLWPDIHNLKFAALCDSLPAGAETGGLSATTIWEAAATYCRQHGVLSIWEEALLTMEGFTMRPQGGAGGLLGERVMLPLPDAAMQSSALGPALASARGWLSATAAPVEPDYAEVAWRGVVRYMLWELCTSTALMLGGLRDALLPNAPARLKRTLRVMLQAQAGAAPFMHAVAELGGELGYPGLLGRSLGRVAFEARSDILERLWAGAATWVQWEEALPLIQKFPDSASIMGLLKPVAISTMDILGLWCHVGHIQGGRGTHDALCSLMGYGPVEVRAAVRSAASGITQLTELPLNGVSYRGKPVDHLYGRLHYGDAKTAEPVFRISDAATIIRAVTGAKKRAEWQWYYSWERDFTFEGILAAYGAAPPTQPNIERIEHAALSPSPGVEPDAPSGTPMGPNAFGPGAMSALPRQPPPAGPQAGGAAAGEPGAADSGASPARIPLAREAQLGRVTAVIHQLPNWVGLLKEAYPKLSSPAPSDRADAEALVRQAAAMVAGYDVFQDLQMAVYAERVPGVQCLKNLALWGAEMASQVGNVNPAAFRAQAAALGNVGGALAHCPAITRNEYSETATGRARFAVFSDDELQNALKCGLSHAEYILTPPGQRREAIEAMAAAMRQAYEADLERLRAEEAEAAARRQAAAETNVPVTTDEQAGNQETTANFGGNGSSTGGLRATATPAEPARQQTRTVPTPAQPQEGQQQPAPAAQLARTAPPAVEPGLGPEAGGLQPPLVSTAGREVDVAGSTPPTPAPLPQPSASGQLTLPGAVSEEAGGTGVDVEGSRVLAIVPSPPPPPPSRQTPRYMTPTVSAMMRSGTPPDTTTQTPSLQVLPLGSTPAAVATTGVRAPAAPGSSADAPSATPPTTGAAAGAVGPTSLHTTAVDFEDPSN